jgi:hypothetical protein
MGTLLWVDGSVTLWITFSPGLALAAERKLMTSATELIRERADSVSGVNRLRPARKTIAEAKARQTSKIRELKVALIEAGLISLDQQARALGLGRSTTWKILSGTHKASGLSAGIVIRVLSAPDVPPLVRSKMLEYVQEKTDGIYGHNLKRSRNFSRRIGQIC